MGWPMHIVAGAGYVFDNKGNILLVKTYSRGWDATGGQIEEGENLEEGVLREIYEESGVTAKIKCLFGIYSNVGKYIYHDGKTTVPTKIMFDFICEYESGELRGSNETSEAIWVPKEKVFDYVKHPVLVYRFKNLLNYNGKTIYSSYVAKPEFKVLTERFV